MSEDLNRRKHVRLEMTEDAIALDEQGKEIGKVLQAGGGGMTVGGASEAAVAKLTVGAKLRVTIVEPGSQTRNTIDVIVRRASGTQIGFEFVTGRSAE